MADEKNNPAMMSRTVLGEKSRLAMPGKKVHMGEPLLAAGGLRDVIAPGVRMRPTISPPAPIRPLPSLPVAMANNPFNDLPFPASGDRIKADDFKKLSQSLRIIYEASLLAGALFGRSFGEAKQLLLTQQYVVSRVMSVFGTEIDDLSDASLDTRKVIQVVPLELGERSVVVILTEAVETRRFTPNLIGLTYREASERLQAMLGDLTFPSTTMTASQLVGLTLVEAKRITAG